MLTDDKLRFVILHVFLQRWLKIDVVGLGFVYDVLALCYLGIVKVHLAPFICASRHDVRTRTARRQVFGLPSQALSYTSSESTRKMVRLTLQRAQDVVVTTE